MSVIAASTKPVLMPWEEVQQNLEVLKTLPEGKKLYTDGNCWHLDNRLAVSLKRGLHNWFSNYWGVGYGFDVKEVKRILGQMREAIHYKQIQEMTAESNETANKDSWDSLLIEAGKGWARLYATYETRDKAKATALENLFQEYITTPELIRELEKNSQFITQQNKLDSSKMAVVVPEEPTNSSQTPVQQPGASGTHPAIARVKGQKINLQNRYPKTTNPTNPSDVTTSIVIPIPPSLGARQSVKYLRVKAPKSLEDYKKLPWLVSGGKNDSSNNLLRTSAIRQKRSSLQLPTIFSGQTWKQEIGHSHADVIQAVSDVNLFCGELIFNQGIGKGVVEVLECCYNVLTVLRAAKETLTSLEKFVQKNVTDVELQMQELEITLKTLAAQEKPMQQEMIRMNKLFLDVGSQITALAEIAKNSSEAQERIMQLESDKEKLLASRNSLVAPRLVISEKIATIQIQYEAMKSTYEESLKSVMAQNKEFYTLFDQGKKSFLEALGQYEKLVTDC
jgi:hypothetical protein